MKNEKNSNHLGEKPLQGSEVISIDVDGKDKPDAPTLSYQDVKYKVNLTQGSCACAKKLVTKEILHGVSGILRPGLNAIMGPTGSGKTSLLDILSNRKDPAGLTGEVLINGMPLPSDFNLISGYVVQSDILIGTLTVRENLWFSANLRLPTSTDRETKLKRVEDVIADLGITHCVDTKVGNEMIRGISGGEKKRVSIAMELICAPSVLFLDEPTTGLDSSTARTVLLHLKRLAESGRTIILSIHQPRYSIFRLFDTLTLLSMGRCVFHGPCQDAIQYFESIDYICEPHNNPADFFLDVINVDSTELNGEVKRETEKADDNPTDSNVTVLERKFKSSQMHRELLSSLDEIKRNTSPQQKTFKSGKGYPTPYLHQFSVLVRRTFISILKNPMASVANLVSSVFISLIFGLLFFQVENDPDHGSQNRFGIIFFFIANLLFGSINCIQVFVKERHIFLHEYTSGYYSALPYFLSKLLGDLIPMRTIAPIVIACISYWMTGLKPTAAAFFTCLLILVLTGYAAISMAVCLSVLCGSFEMASVCITLVFILNILYCGLMVNVDSLMPWLGWIRYLSIAFYSFSGLSINEFQGLTFTQCDQSAELSDTLERRVEYLGLEEKLKNASNCVSIRGEKFLAKQLAIGNGYDDLDGWALWSNVVALATITVVLLTLTFFQLSRTKTKL